MKQEQVVNTQVEPANLEHGKQMLILVMKTKNIMEEVQNSLVIIIITDFFQDLYVFLQLFTFNSRSAGGRHVLHTAGG